MKTTNLVVGALLLLGGQANADDADLDALFKSSFRPSIEGEQCISNFKETMSDPKSFELAGEFSYNVGMTRVLTLQKKGDPEPSLAMGLPPLIKDANYMMVSAPIRGKNKFGGMVLQRLQCIFIVASDEIKFVGSWIAPPIFDQ